MIHEENWIFLRKETGYLHYGAVKWKQYNVQLARSSEYSKNAAYLCVCGGQKSMLVLWHLKNAQKKLYHLMIKSQNADSAEL